MAPFKIVLVHKLDISPESDDADDEWQVWTAESFGMYYDDNMPAAHGPTREAALHAFRVEEARRRMRWPNAFKDSEPPDGAEFFIEDFNIGDVSNVPLWRVFSKNGAGHVEDAVICTSEQEAAKLVELRTAQSYTHGPGQLDTPRYGRTSYMERVQ